MKVEGEASAEVISVNPQDVKSILKLILDE